MDMRIKLHYGPDFAYPEYAYAVLEAAKEDKYKIQVPEYSWIVGLKHSQLDFISLSMFVFREFNIFFSLRFNSVFR